MASEKTYKGFAQLLALVCLVFLRRGVAEGRVLHREIELKRMLKQINKPAVKSIKGQSGEVIDCVDIYKQPAFDHPLLQNHTIQNEPSFHQSKVKETFSDDDVLQRFHPTEQCPEGTIPIQRIQKKDLLRAASLTSYGKKYLHHLPRMESTGLQETGYKHEHSIAYVGDGKFYGTKAFINVWNPRVNPVEFSIAQIWVLSDNVLDNTVEAGWTVYPLLSGDNETRLFTYWTADGYKQTGCYNLVCPGFIQTNNKYLINAKIAPLSTYGGKQLFVSIEIRKDKETGDWWLIVEDNVMGYWPKAVVPAFGESAPVVEWGGEIVKVNGANAGATTEMGSGHFSGEGFGKAAYFSNVQIIDDTGTLRDAEGLQTVSESPSCYDLKLDGNKGGELGTLFYYGGPGKSENCP